MNKTVRAYKCNCKEVSIAYNGTSYLVILGKHVNGAYCAFPQLNVAAELSGYDGDYGYNEKKLRLAFTGKESDDKETVAALARIITDILQELPDVLPF